MINLSDEDEERFWAKVQIPVNMVDECWEFQSLRPDGYGQFSFRKPNGRRDTKMSHRISYELTNRPIPQGMCVCHKCDNPGCVNPCHFFIGTVADNVADMDKKGRRVNSPSSGPTNGFAKLTPEKVLAIVAASMDGCTRESLAVRFDTCQTNISSIMLGKTWSHLTGIKGA